MEKLTKKILITLTAVIGMMGVAATIAILVFWSFGDPLARYVKPNAVWTATDFHEMLAHCSSERLVVLEQSLKLKDPVGTSFERGAAIKKDLELIRK